MFAKMKKKELQEMLREHGLPVNGNKSDLLKRLKRVIHDEQKSPPENTTRHKQSIDSDDDIEEETLNILPPRTSKSTVSAEMERIQFERYMLEREQALFDQRRELFERQQEFAATARVVPEAKARMMSIREISEILPEFDPANKINGSAERFIKRIRDLQSVYKWDEKLMLYAAQTKLRGYAKTWNDSSENVYQDFDIFACELQMYFPNRLNEADIHASMLNNRRTMNEDVTEYFHNMCALGKRGGLCESTIVSYIRRGLNNVGLQNALACVDIKTLSDLQGALTRYSENSATTSSRPLLRAAVKSFYGKENLAAQNSKSNNNNSNSTSSSASQASSSSVEKTGQLSSGQGPRCYNCYVRGHISKACPLPPRVKCNTCNKYGHRAEECPDKPPVSQVLCIADETATSEELTKEVLVNNVKLTAVVDSGSSKSLIRQSSAMIVERAKLCEPITFKGFGGTLVQCNEMIQPNVKIDNKTFRSTLYVVADDLLSSEMLLGRDMLCKTGNRVIIEDGITYVEPAVEEEPQQLCNEVADLIDKFPGCFSETVSKIGKYKHTEMVIKLKSDITINRRPYRIPFSKRAIVTDIVNDLLESQIIQPSKSSFASPIVLVKKQNGEDRMCIDYRELNAITVKQLFWPVTSILRL